MAGVEADNEQPFYSDVLQVEEQSQSRDRDVLGVLASEQRLVDQPFVQEHLEPRPVLNTRVLQEVQDRLRVLVDQPGKYCHEPLHNGGHFGPQNLVEDSLEDVGVYLGRKLFEVVDDEVAEMQRCRLVHGWVEHLSDDPGHVVGQHLVLLDESSALESVGTQDSC